MNIKDFTSTTFGLLVAYLLPGLAGLYAISLYPNDVANLFARPTDSMGFVLLVLSALLVGVFVNGVRSLILFFISFNRVEGAQAQERFKALHALISELTKSFPDEYWNRIENSDKLACVVAVVDEYYRAHQFFGSLAVISPVLYVGWARCSVLSGPEAAVFGLLTMLATIGASCLTWKYYIEIGHRILEGELPASVFSDLLRVVNKQGWPENEKGQLRGQIAALTNAKGTPEFVTAYHQFVNQFVTLAADRRHALAPLFATLTEWLRR